MLRSTLIASFMLSATAGVALETKAMEPAKNPAPILYAQATPQTVQVERGGAQIYTQPESNAQVIGEYRAGVVLSPRLRLFNPEGQAWLRIGDHWIAEESVMVFEGESNTVPSSARPTPIDLPTPASASAPPKVSPQQTKTQPSPSPAAPPSPQNESTVSPTSPSISTSSPTAPAKPAEPQPATEAVTPAPVKQPAVATQPTPAKPASPSPAKPKPEATAKSTATSSNSNQGTLITKDPTAQVNVRTANNTQSDVIHAGNAGDQIQILKSQAGESGYTWYQVKFPVAKVQGWVRGDFIKLGNQ